MNVVKINLRDFAELNDLESVDLNEIGVEVRAYNRTLEVKRVREAELNANSYRYATVAEWLLDNYGDCDVIQADWMMTDKILHLLLVREEEKEND